MNDPVDRPSYLALDRSVASGEMKDFSASPGYVVRHLARLRTPEPVPGWARGLAGERARARRAWLAPLLAAAVALGSAAVVFTGIRRTDVHGKGGTPAVAAYVKRSGHVTLWDGRGALTSGDELRLKIAPSGFSYISVFSYDASSTSALLYSAPVDGKVAEVLLPVAWKVDSEGSHERLRVVLSRSPVRDAAEAPPSPPAASASTWSIDLDFPKEQ